MSDYIASDPKSIRRAAKAAKLADAERREVVLTLMSSPSGRNYVWDFLTRCHVFETTFSLNPYAAAFNEGNRNLGLHLLADVMSAAPDQYIQMTREANDRHIADDRGHQRDNPNGGRPDNGWPDDAGRSGDEYVDRDSGEDLTYRDGEA